MSEVQLFFDAIRCGDAGAVKALLDQAVETIEPLVKLRQGGRVLEAQNLERLIDMAYFNLQSL